MKARGSATVAIFSVLTLLVSGLGSAANLSTYAAAGTLVAKQSGQGPLLDDGGAACFAQPHPPLPMGLGGGCLSFPADGRPGFVRVADASIAGQVAFQVCIDMNQDGHCFMRQPVEGEPFKPLDQCDDRVGFSHADNGAFFNPLGFYYEPQPFGLPALKPLPTSLPPPGVCPAHDGSAGVPRPAWPGYIVFLCEGVHLTNMPHAHTPTTGTISLETVQQPAPGAGTFCQTIRDQLKEYYVMP